MSEARRNLLVVLDIIFTVKQVHLLKQHVANESNTSATNAMSIGQILN